ncbi:hypothetical protein AGMMS50256_18790 [Betaproteobacteria bacterium]|nr:hypothetical protein AGMMS50256_18790 [Betaproteobacteria bacterium]
MSEFTFNVLFEDGVWIGICDELPVTTESDTYEGLVDRVWRIAPEMFVENKHPGSLDELRISFVQERTTRPTGKPLTQAASSHVAL